MGTGNASDTVEQAANSLTPKYRQTAFKWAIQLIFAKEKPIEEQNEILEDLKIKLLIDSGDAKSLITEMNNSR
jgi:hypothetical protein